MRIAAVTADSATALAAIWAHSGKNADATVAAAIAAALAAAVAAAIVAATAAAAAEGPTPAISTTPEMTTPYSRATD